MAYSVVSDVIEMLAPFAYVAVVAELAFVVHPTNDQPLPETGAFERSVTVVRAVAVPGVTVCVPMVVLPVLKMTVQLFKCNSHSQVPAPCPLFTKDIRLEALDPVMDFETFFQVARYSPAAACSGSPVRRVLSPTRKVLREEQLLSIDVSHRRFEPSKLDKSSEVREEQL